jgi:hypothetical protein
MVWEFTTVIVSGARDVAVRWQWRRTDGKARGARLFLTYREAYEDAIEHGLQEDHACIVVTGHARMPCDLRDDPSPSFRS